jgi:hypothetical protein
MNGGDGDGDMRQMNVSNEEQSGDKCGNECKVPGKWGIDEIFKDEATGNNAAAKAKSDVGKRGDRVTMRRQY